MTLLSINGSHLEIKRGKVYTSHNSHHDDVDYTVYYEPGDADTKLETLFEHEFDEGKRARSQEIGRLLGVN